MPLFDYRCRGCGRLTELFVRAGRERPPGVTCVHCGSEETAHVVSRFSVVMARSPKYTESFRERAAGFLKSRPGAGEIFARGGESEEAKVYRLTEQIGERVDAALERAMPPEV